MVVEYPSMFDLSLTSSQDHRGIMKTPQTLQSNNQNLSRKSFTDSRDPKDEGLDGSMRFSMLIGEQSKDERFSGDLSTDLKTRSSTHDTRKKNNNRESSSFSSSWKNILSTKGSKKSKEVGLAAPHTPNATTNLENGRPKRSPLRVDGAQSPKKYAIEIKSSSTNKQKNDENRDQNTLDSSERREMSIPNLDITELPIKNQQLTSFLKTGQESIIRSSETDATDWQIELPALHEVRVANKFCHFINTYRLSECSVDLATLIGFSRYQLTCFSNNPEKERAMLKPYFHSTVGLLLEYGVDFIQVAGHIRMASTATTMDENNNPDEVHEILIVERQRQFMCIVQGTSREQQQGKISFLKSSSQPNTTKVSYSATNASHECVEIFNEPYATFARVQKQLFLLLDRLTDQNPFMDVVFTGHGYGATIANIAAFAYANTRPMIRVGSIGFNVRYTSGGENFRRAVHSSPNLNVIRADLGSMNQSKSSKQCDHVGHLIVIDQCVSHSPLRILKKSSSDSSKSDSDDERAQPVKLVKAYKFGNLTRNVARARSPMMTKKSETATGVYFDALNALNVDDWIRNFEDESGPGIYGTNKEYRRVA